MKALSAKVTQALSILKANGYGDDSYETGSINVYPEYNYINGRSEIVGQTASQSLTIRARGVDPKGQKVGVLVDALAQVDGINIDSVSFDIYDKTKLQTQARADAYKDARQKAEDYASFAGLSLGRVLSIDDTNTVEAPPAYLNSFAGAPQAMKVSSSTSVPLGDLDVNYRTTVTYSLRWFMFNLILKLYSIINTVNKIHSEYLF